MTTDPSAPSPSDRQDDRSRPPGRSPDAGFAASTCPTHAVPPIPPLPPHPPVFPAFGVVSAAPAGPAGLDPVHPAPGAPCPDSEPFPVHETGTGTGVGMSGPKTTGPDPAQRPSPVRTPAERPRTPQPGGGSEAHSGCPDGGRTPAPGPFDAPVSVRDHGAPGPAPEVAGEPTPVRDAIEDPRPLRKESPTRMPTPLPDRGRAALPGDTDAALPLDPAEDAAPHDSEQPIHTLLWTAATERPVEEVAALVSRLTRTGEVDSPGDLALRAAAVSRPLEEVRQLVALLNDPHPLHEADTTLRSAAVGRPIEDVVPLMKMIGTDAGERRPAAQEAALDAPPTGAFAALDNEAGAVAAAEPSQKSPWPVAALNGALADGPDSHVVSPALRSGLRRPTALVLFACGVIHLPADVAGLRSGGYAETLSVAVTALCLVVAVWLALRDTPPVWAAASGLAVGVIALHALAGMGTLNLMQSSLGASVGWARAAAVLCAGATALLAGSALRRRPEPAAGATHNT
ncbi:hypothetical protein [Streptomyces xantholiticus]|uniref:hypothetical protein n=1 Tax=Streptomyces xantholiticus TaxID=68285 RepID=UPI0019A0E4FF|nr:hypothetical protein [Streptomyces xantholiticus]GGW40382.1 hypothetical protein GCM10010381_26720 [Streptomyces xantholiticus]